MAWPLQPWECLTLCLLDRGRAGEQEGGGDGGMGTGAGSRASSEGSCSQLVETVFPKIYHLSSRRQICSSRRDGPELLIQPLLPLSSFCAGSSHGSEHRGSDELMLPGTR